MKVFVITIVALNTMELMFRVYRWASATELQHTTGGAVVDFALMLFLTLWGVFLLGKEREGHDGEIMREM